MQRKITWVILFSIFILVITIQNMENLTQPRMVNQNVYSWSSDNSNFEKESKAVIYAEAPKNKVDIFRLEQLDLNNNLILENYILENGRMVIMENSKIIWQSPNNWWIDDFVLADSNNDGIVDMNLSLWKSGNFGMSKPFWVKENDLSVKNHLFILDFVDGTMKQVWGSSNLETPNCEFDFADVDGDRKNDLIVVEGDYSQKLKCDGNYVAVWKWNDWGFSNEWRSEKGNFSNLEIEKIDGESHIMVNSF